MFKKLTNAVWGVVKSQVKPAITAITAAILTVFTLGCTSPYQNPSSKSQTSSVYAFGLPAVVITHDNKQVADNSGEDRNTAYNEAELHR